MSENKLKWWIALIVVIIVFVIYFYNVSPTVSFWDCGEFLACSYILGIPHPPGTPLYVLIGKIFSMIPVFPEIALRINIISVLCGAFGAALVYLLVYEIIKGCSGFGFIEKHKFIPHVAGLIASFFSAFAYSIWNNSLEAEVYAPSFFIGLIVVWGALKWRRKEEQGEDASYMVLGLLYLIFLSAGIHLTPVMSLFAMIPFIFVVKKEYLAPFFIAVILLFDVLYEPNSTLSRLFHGGVAFLLIVYLFYLSSKRKITQDTAWTGSIITVIAYIIWIFLTTSSFLKYFNEHIIGTFYWFTVLACVLGIRYRQDRYYLKYLLIGVFLLFVAFSVQFYLYVRARLHPDINMVDPSNWKNFISVLRREQYGVAKIENQLWPRKTVVNIETGEPTGISPFVGILWQIFLYIRYFLWQWGLEIQPSPLSPVYEKGIFGIIGPLVTLIAVFLGFYGMYSLFKRDRKAFWFLLSIYLIASLGLVAYLNLRFSPSDTWHTGMPREVRERDYFFVFSFVFFTLFIGMGVAELLHSIFKKQRDRFRVNALPVTFLLFVASIIPVVYNWKKVTRRGNWIPAEYGYNILACCDEPSVVFTNGDNDTFPLWFVQEVPSTHYGNKPYKPKVINANLSLLNTPWYIKQLKRKGAPISFSYEEIDNLPPYLITPDRKIIYLRDIIIRDLIATNAGIRYSDRDKVRVGSFTPIPIDYVVPDSIFWNKVLDKYKETVMPIYFSNTVERGILKSYLPYLTLEGIVYRVRGPKGERINVAKSIEILEKRFKMSSILDPKVKKDEDTRGLFVNYAATMTEIATYLLLKGRKEEAYRFVRKILKFEMEPEDKRIFYYQISQFAIETGRYEEALILLDSVSKWGFRDPELYMRQALAYFGMGDKELAKRAMKLCFVSSGGRIDYFMAIFNWYRYTLHQPEKAYQFLKLWDEAFPGNHYTWIFYLRHLKDTADALSALERIPDKRDLEKEVLDSLKKKLR